MAKYRVLKRSIVGFISPYGEQFDAWIMPGDTFELKNEHLWMTTNTGDGPHECYMQLAWIPLALKDGTLEQLG